MKTARKFLFLLGLNLVVLLSLVSVTVVAEDHSTTMEISQRTEQTELSSVATTTISEQTLPSEEVVSTPSSEPATTKEVETEPQTTEEAVEENSSSETRSLYCLYHPGLRVHLYTKDSNEYNVLGGRGWQQEGVAWKTSLSQGEKVYRLFHPDLRIHLYTKDTNEYAFLGNRGWQKEGEAFRSYGQQPIYRLYHAGLQRHLYTTDTKEYQVLGSRGWQQEGIAFYGLGAPGQPLPPNNGKLSGKITIENVNHQKGSFDVRISGISSPKGLKSVLVPVWSAEKGQDDLAWYEAKPEANGTYRVRVEARNHKYSRGTYYIHLYYKTLENRDVLVTSTQHTVQIRQSIAEGKVSVQNINSQRGTFEVYVTDIFAPNGIKEVSIPVWTETRGQDDIRWYAAKRLANGVYQATIYIADHRYQKGLYHVHAYIRSANGQQTGIGTQRFNMPFDGLQYNGNYYQIHGKYGYIPIINKKHPINAAYNPGKIRLPKFAFNALTNQMRALGFGISYSYSGFRSYSTQHGLYWNYVRQYGQAAADRFSARPGYSEHQSGLAFDVFGTGGGLLAQPNAVHWLAHNAHRYGFIVRYQAGKEWITGYMAEAWHIRYIGPEAADIYHSGLSLEEYFGVAGGGY